MTPTEPVGATANGYADSLPKKRVLVERLEVSRRVRVRNAMRLKAARFSANACSSSTPRSTNSNKPLGNLALAIRRKSSML